MGLEKNIWFGILITLIGIVLVISAGWPKIEMTIAGPKIILTPVLIIIGILIIYNWYRSRK